MTMTIDQFMIAVSLLRSLYTGNMSQADVCLMLDKLEKATEPHLVAMSVCVSHFIQDNPEMFPYL